MKDKMSVKLSDENINFLNKVGINRIKTDMETKIITPSDALLLIEKYFKLKNNSYLELIHMESKK